MSPQSERRSYLITGGAGFIGSHLAEELLSRGSSVTIVDDLSTGREENLAHLRDNPDFEFVEGSVLEGETLSPMVSENGIIYHLAAGVGVRRVLDRPVKTLRTNVGGTESVLSLAARERNKKVILASTSEIYGKNEDPPFGEEDDRVLGPPSTARWGYSCSKAFDEFLSLAYYSKWDLPVVILRLFNVVGPRQTGKYGMVVPKVVGQALRGDPITIYGDGEQTRCFAHIKDVVEAMADISDLGRAEGEVFNLGDDREVSINQLAETVKRVTESSSDIVHIPYEEAYGEGFEDMRRRVPDISKIKGFLDYDPNYQLEDIIRSVAEGIREGNRASS